MYVHKVFRQVATIAFSAFLMTWIAKGLGAVAHLAHGRRTGIDLAVDNLLHYTDALPTIVAFTWTSILVAALTLLAEPSWLVAKLRKWAAIPALQIAEHALAVGIGVWTAQVLLEAQSAHLTPLIALREFTLFVALLILFALLALIPAALAYWLEYKYETVIAIPAKYRYPIIVAVAALVVALFYHELAFNAVLLEPYATKH